MTTRLIALLCLAILTGCGGGADDADYPAVDPVTGKAYPYEECVADAVYCGKPADEVKSLPRLDCRAKPEVCQ